MKMQNVVVVGEVGRGPLVTRCPKMVGSNAVPGSGRTKRTVPTGGEVRSGGGVSGKRRTFRELVEDSRVAAAESARTRAQQARLLGRGAMMQGRRRAAAALFTLEAKANRRAEELAPERVNSSVVGSSGVVLAPPPSIRPGGLYLATEDMLRSHTWGGHCVPVRPGTSKAVIACKGA
jgi:hypothetical protein